MPLRLTFLGTGTSVGVPMPGCDCSVCRSPDPRDNRWRASVLLEWPDARVVIDTTPEFRLQMLRANVRRLDAILFTHNHADHVHGLDDVRSFNIAQRAPVPLYGSPAMLDWLRTHFRYIWEPLQEGGGLPKIELRPVSEPFEIAGVTITPLPVWHGKLPIYGYRVGDLAYLSDVSDIPETTWPLLAGLRVLVVDAVRYEPHLTHFHVEKAVEVARRAGATRTFLTHMNHDILYARLAAELPEGVEPAYDGLAVEC